ncbi:MULTISPECIES: hypothetical protein [Mammaliicoccus]|uniref:hypothetical protein n=1 Tax=Mammaliicoccus TaxID=2803850 RepID=UPI00099262C7|nr:MULTISPECIES: hypothetical protein [Mammaliicoccus]MBO3063531.1 hypothetical protein [Mammaliicoccus fleurettii]MEB7781408.1 hypothetical protein [Mammaliicoccus fleurettii]OOV75688.1 hypothetical protein B2G86_11620 [Mammaliicoccus fleurettii]
MTNGLEVLIWKQNKVAKKFIDEQATSPQSAKTYENLNIKYNRTFTNLYKKGIIKKSGKKYFLDNEEWKKFKKSYKRIFLL